MYKSVICKMIVPYSAELEWLFAKWFEAFEEALKNGSLDWKAFKRKNPNFYYNHIRDAAICARRLKKSKEIRLQKRGVKVGDFSLAKNAITFESRFYIKNNKLFIAYYSAGCGGREYNKSIWLSYELQGQIEKLKNVKVVNIVKRNGEYYADFVCEVFEKPLLKPEEIQTFLGVDRGIKNIAVACLCNREGVPIHNPWYFGGGEVVQRRLTLRDMKRVYGKAKRMDKIKETRGTVSDFVRDANHQISRQIVDIAITNNAVIVFEDLKNICNSGNKHKRIWNYLKAGWSYGQLQFMVEYKAKEFGIPVLYVDPKDTSKICSKCGEIGERDKLWFSCHKCGYQYNADANAALNIAKLGREHILNGHIPLRRVPRMRQWEDDVIYDGIAQVSDNS